MRNINEDIESIGLTFRGAEDLTNDRGQCRPFIRTHRRKWLALGTDDDECNVIEHLYSATPRSLLRGALCDRLFDVRGHVKNDTK